MSRKGAKPIGRPRHSPVKGKTTPKKAGGKLVGGKGYVPPKGRSAPKRTGSPKASPREFKKTAKAKKKYANRSPRQMGKERVKGPNGQVMTRGAWKTRDKVGRANDRKRQVKRDKKKAAQKRTKANNRSWGNQTSGWVNVKNAKPNKPISKKTLKANRAKPRMKGQKSPGNRWTDVKSGAKHKVQTVRSNRAGRKPAKAAKAPKAPKPYKGKGKAPSAKLQRQRAADKRRTHVRSNGFKKSRHVKVKSSRVQKHRNAENNRRKVKNTGFGNTRKMQGIKRKNGGGRSYNAVKPTARTRRYGVTHSTIPNSAWKQGGVRGPNGARVKLNTVW